MRGEPSGMSCPVVGRCTLPLPVLLVGGTAGSFDLFLDFLIISAATAPAAPIGKTPLGIDIEEDDDDDDEEEDDDDDEEDEAKEKAGAAAGNATMLDRPPAAGSNSSKPMPSTKSPSPPAAAAAAARFLSCCCFNAYSAAWAATISEYTEFGWSGTID